MIIIIICFPFELFDDNHRHVFPRRRRRRRMENHKIFSRVFLAISSCRQQPPFKYRTRLNANNDLAIRCATRRVCSRRATAIVTTVVYASVYNIIQPCEKKKSVRAKIKIINLNRKDRWCFSTVCACVCVCV